MNSETILYYTGRFKQGRLEEVHGFAILRNCTEQNPDGVWIGDIHVRDLIEAAAIAKAMGWTQEGGQKP